MRCVCFLVLMIAASGCSANLANKVRKGDHERTVVNRYGKPDVIVENSGSLERKYSKVTKEISDYEWPSYAIKTYYYLEAQVVITMQYHKVISVDSLTEKDRELVQDLLKSGF